ncbi:hypothetical protein SEA_RUCHI_26 [Arthrobacter phage Ruchi]|nr:hypothetical protein SEA_BASILISK_27 [Arthrobacter phage Basilisk]WNM69474.1 hypothetical protein SEA_RUCHI_26 [Arthrobacter phage Ruchi]
MDPIAKLRAEMPTRHSSFDDTYTFPGEWLRTLTGQAAPEPTTRREPDQPMWQGDREYLQAQHVMDWTPERYGGRK